ncbi:hypothetical protein BGZ96_003077 [Linnemannia gamsii]|uniref:Uncharacterized protein n=1 Tax=Linnemannia gamsii TaxID=64522 RepID=A0ABQ7K841_9FUNG|nr:hypothetical protein BGZ96_003077 [Linnemannia gamsii]
MAIVYAQELHIAHLDDGSHPTAPRAPIKISAFEKSHWKIVPHPVQPHLGPKVAELTSVWWLDVAAIFSQATSNAPTKAGRYKVEWRMNLNVAETDNVVVGTEFRAITFRKDEDPNSPVVTEDREPAIWFKPQSLQEFMSHTDHPNSVPALPKSLQQAQALELKPGYDANNQGFFTLTLPGEVILQEDPDGGGAEGNVLVQMRNHDKTVKMGMHIEYVKLVPAE